MGARGMFWKMSSFIVAGSIIVSGCTGSRLSTSGAAQNSVPSASITGFTPSTQSAEILAQLQTGEEYQGKALNKDQLLKNARSSTKASDNCKGQQPRLNVNNAAIYIAEAENISTFTAKSIEDYTSKKFNRDTAIVTFNQIVARANSLKHWGDANDVLGACGSASIVTRISKANATKNQLIATYRELLDK